MSKHELSPRQRRFVTAMMTARTVAEAAQAIGVTERTGFKYLAHPGVKEALSHALDQAMAQATRRVVAGMAAALETLQRIHIDDDKPPGSRVAAARAVLAAGPLLREATDLALRLGALEEKMAREAR